MALFSVLTPFEEKRQDDYQVSRLVCCAVEYTVEPKTQSHRSRSHVCLTLYAMCAADLSVICALHAQRARESAGRIEDLKLTLLSDV